MKSRKYILFLLPLLIVSLFNCVTLSQNIDAVLSRIKGDVKVQRAGETKWTAATDKMKVSQGDSIRTGAGAEVFVSWNENAVRLGPLSQTKLSTIGGANEKSLVDLSKGKIFCKVRGKQKNETIFEVRTPIATAGVRGTSFEAAEKSFSVVEGTVSIKSGDSEIELTAGMMLELVEEGLPEEPMMIPQEQMQNLNDMDKNCDSVITETSSEAGGESGESKSSGESSSQNEASVADAIESSENAIDTSSSTVDVLNSYNYDLEAGTGGILFYLFY